MKLAAHRCAPSRAAFVKALLLAALVFWSPLGDAQAVIIETGDGTGMSPRRPMIRAGRISERGVVRPSCIWGAAGC